MSPASVLRPVGTLVDLLAASDGDAFVRYESRVAADGTLRGPAWAGPEAVVFARRVEGAGPQRLTAVGGVEAAVRLLVLAVEELGGPPAAVTVPRGSLALLPESLRPPQPEDWDWFWTATQPPHVPGEDRVDWLDAGADAELRAFLGAASPRHSAEPGSPYIRRWCGVRSPDGRLLACAAHVEYVPGVPHLASIATSPAVRGQGLGAAMTAWLTRAALAAAGVSTLGMYADNEVARRLYRRLGYADSHRFTSGRLL